MNARSSSPTMSYDVAIVGAGFAGLYALHKMRQLGFSAHVYEAGDDIGGTWYWNRYPGARCDVESMQYSYSFSDEIQQEWNWTERYAAQPEILKYINFVAERLSLRQGITLSTRVSEVRYHDTTQTWTLETRNGDLVRAKYVILATGCLSVPLVPDIPGIDDFQGDVFKTSAWPHHAVDFSGRTVGLIGTGSSGIQATPVVAEQADQLIVFQRTPNYSIPAHNAPLDPAYVSEWKSNYKERRSAARQTRNNTLNRAGTCPGRALSREERELEFERRWNVDGGISFMYAYPDMTSDEVVNEHASEFVRSKIASIVRDPAVASILIPKNYGIGGRRICVDTKFYDTFNRDNVRLVDVRAEPIQRITRDGILTSAGEHKVDSIVLAIGFDAMTGALLRMDIRGKGGLTLREHWKNGPKTYLGVAISGFPNLFIITGPGSPSVLTNMVASIEQHVEWIAGCLSTLRGRGGSVIEVDRIAEDEWFEHVNAIGSQTIFSGVESWYTGANVPGKPRVVMPYTGGADTYSKICDEVVANDYRGFVIS